MNTLRMALVLMITAFSVITAGAWTGKDAYAEEASYAIEGVVFDVEGDLLFVDLNDYAVSFQSGNELDQFFENQLVAYIRLGSDKYVSLAEYAAVLNDGVTSQDIYDSTEGVQMPDLQGVEVEDGELTFRDMGMSDDDEAADSDVPEGGTVTYGFTQPFSGLFSWAFYGSQGDAIPLSIFNGEGLYEIGDDLMPKPDLATWAWNDDHTEVTFHLEEGVKWHNGEELTVDDFLFAWEIIADPDYAGTRFSNVDQIEGASAYRRGEADEIEGVAIIDDYTMTVTFEEADIHAFTNLWIYPEPRAHLGHLDVSDMPESDEIRKNPVGLGAFKVSEIVPGERVEMTAFSDYWKGEPHLDSVVYRIVDGLLAGELLAQGELDMIQLSRSQAVDLEGDDRVQLEQIEALSYSYIGFNLGHWDGRENVMDNPKFADKRVRQAFAHAIDREGIVNSFNDGYGTVIDAPGAVNSWAYPDESALNTYTYNPERARSLLEEAGYEDVTGDGFYEDPDGEAFDVNLMAMSGSDLAPVRAQYIVQNLKDAGVNAQLLDGSLVDFNTFYERLENDDPDIDLFINSRGLGVDPDPSGTWKSNDFWNFSRWVNEESDELISRGLSDDAFDPEYRKQVYQEWHQLVNDELPVIPLMSPAEIYGVANDVHGYTIGARNATADPHLWYREQ